MLYLVGMTAKETTLGELGEMLAHVVEHMVTKADIAALGEQVASIERDLTTIRRDLNDLADKVDNISGFRKEIDHALRIATMENHLGIAKQHTA